MRPVFGVILSATLALAPRLAPGDVPSADAPPPAPRPFVDRRIHPDPTRDALVRDYLAAHCARRAEAGTRIEPRVVVIHWTGMGTAESAWRYFDRVEIEPGRAAIRAQGRLNVGTHFLVDRSGEAVRLVPEDRFARHTIGLNTVAVGIDLVGGRPEDLTEAQLRRVEAIVRYLHAHFPIRFVIGHDESHRMEGTDLWCEDVPGYRSRKGDPGRAFMSRLRKRLEDLGIQGPPAPPP